MKNPKKPTYAQRKELSKLGYDPREYMIIAAPPHEFTLLHIPTGKIISEVARMKWYVASVKIVQATHGYIVKKDF